MVYSISKEEKSMGLPIHTAITNMAFISLAEETLLAEIVHPHRAGEKLHFFQALAKRYQESPSDTLFRELLSIGVDLLQERLSARKVEDIYQAFLELQVPAYRNGHAEKDVTLFTSLRISFIALHRFRNFYDALPKRRIDKECLLSVIHLSDISKTPLFECTNSIVYFVAKTGLCLKISKTRSDEVLMKEFAAGRMVSGPLLKSHALTYLRDGTLGLISECKKGGDLCTLRMERTIKHPELRAIMKRALLALKFLHDRSLVHGDIKPENFFGKPEAVVLGDHDGIQRIGRRAITGTDPYASPEMFRAFKSKRPVEMTSAMDIWSLGVMLADLLGNPYPYPGGAYIEGFYRLQEAHLNAPAPFDAILKQSLRIAPHERATVDELLVELTK